MSSINAGNRSGTQVFTGQQHRLELTERLGAPGLTPERVEQILERYLDDLETELLAREAGADIGRVQEMLLEIAGFIRTDGSKVPVAQRRYFLERLIELYGKGFAVRGKSAFSVTAADYAEVIEVISAECPNYDFSQAVGQLICYMQQLFESRKESWITIYQHIESMSDSNSVVQLLKDVYLREIRQWAEEGVANLFGIESDLLNGIRELDERIESLQQRLAARVRDGGAPTASVSSGRVIDLRQKRTQREIDALRRQIEQLQQARQDKEAVAELIRSNIHEFQTKLKETRRAYLLRAV
ncbi:MAG TPA: hypothetical protein ENK50_12360 [Sedimenticola sp.]|nr:hypothetical protein [Sedimenticola sp.]